ncbi:hypothetical protein BA6E_1031, partial [Bacteroidales bacterium 6E]
MSGLGNHEPLPPELHDITDIKTVATMKKLYFLQLGFFLVLQLVAAGVFANLPASTGMTAETATMAGVPAAPALTGTFTIGATGDYATISAAITALQTDGISGPVVFDIQSGTYAEQFTLGPVTGASATNTITFRSATGNAADVTITHSAAGTADNYVVLLENASHYILQNLKFVAGGTTYARTIRGQLELQNILVEGCILESPLATSTSGDRGNVIISASTSADVRFINNTITGGSYGIFYQGTNNSSARSLGLVLSGNTISNIYYQGINLDRFFEAHIINNVVSIMTGSSSSSIGIELTYVDGAIRVVDNRVTGARSYAIYFNDSQAL